MNIDFLKQRYNREAFKEFIREFIPDFVDENAIITPEREIFQDIVMLGNGLGGELAVVEIRTRKVKNSERVTITKEAFRIMSKRGISQAIVCFYAGGQSWRMSLLTTNVVLKDGKIKREGSNPRRHSYYLGEKAKTKTPYKFLIEKGKVTNLEELKERFSVDTVNEQFYKSIAELYMKLVGGKRDKIEYSGLLKVSGINGSKEQRQEFAVRLIGRIVFCWFLKEKKPASGIALIDNSLLSRNAVLKNSDYYHSILEPLFFGLLNTPVDDRPESLKKGRFADVPYLNGGLFAPQLTDHYGDNKISVPDAWFSDLFEILEQYNFTVDENTSYDADLSIDPEMLGRIFENLLAEINPQTNESARKNTGSFYTPREIVDYMVDSSLLYYLKDKTKVSKAKLKAIISYDKEDDEESPLDGAERQQIVDALDELTILDPACGSGAFPIGILQKVVYILQQIDKDGRLWFEKQIKNMPSIEMQNSVRDKFANENFDYIRKLGVIRQSIFGVDVQTIATEIAKLRCFLTLVVDEDVDDGKHNRGIDPLPNLDFKFVTANSLIDLSISKKEAGSQTSLLENLEHIEKLKQIRNKYFAASPNEKIELKDKFKDLQHDMFMSYRSMGGNITDRYDRLMCWTPFKNEATDWFNPEWMFGVEKFDIVIANPPYVHLEKIKDEANRLYKPLGFKTYDARGDLYLLFFERGVELLKEHGILTFITSNKWMRAGYGEGLRNFFVENTHPIQIIDLGGGVFASATVDTDILMLKKEPYFADTQAVAANKELNANNIESFVAERAMSVRFKKDESWTILSPIEQNIKEKIERFGVPLKDWDIRINYGIKTGCNEAFIINEETRAKLIAEDPKSAEIIRPILRGKDIKRNGYEWAGLYVILAVFDSHKWLEQKYPAVYRHLSQYEDKLKKRGQCRYLSSGKTHNPSDYDYPGYPGMHHWLELDNNPRRKYMDDFDKQKICYQELSQGSTFYLDQDDHFIVSNTGYILVGNDLDYLIKFLNSKFVEYCFRKFYSTTMGETGLRWLAQYIKNLPIPYKTSQIISYFESEKNQDSAIYKIFNLTQPEIDFIENSLSN